MDVSEYLGNISDRKIQAWNLFNKVQSVFQEKGLNLLKSTRFETWGQDSKKQTFVLALFSNSSDARMFENKAVQARKKGFLKVRTKRMEPWEDPAFPIPTYP